VKNTHATDALVLGGSTVTGANGFSLAAGATLEVFLDSGDSLYGAEPLLISRLMCFRLVK
jgi:hypothetical protein